MDSRRGGEASLLQRWYTAHDQSARDELVDRYLPLVRSLARRYSYTSEPFEDLCQVGSIALLRALDRYVPGRGASFRAYAVPTIMGELRRHFRDTGWAVHIPRPLQERAREAGIAVNALAARLGRSPTIREVADWMELPVEQVIEAMDVRLAYDTAPLDAASATGADDSRYEAIEYAAVFERTLRGLPPREREILHLRFAEDLSQTEIAGRLGCSQMQISRLLRRALARLQAVAGVDAPMPVPAAGRSSRA